MSKVIRFIQNYLIFSLPFVAACILWRNNPEYTGILRVSQELLFWNLALWFIVFTSFLIMLVIVPKAQELTLRRLANIKERDEREQYITGKAARVTYISTFSLMLFLLFCSIFSVNITRIPQSQILDNKNYPKHSLNVQVGFNLFEKVDGKRSQQEAVVFDSKSISPSKSTIILILLAWQLVIFNLIARKEQIKGLR